MSATVPDFGGGAETPAKALPLRPSDSILMRCPGCRAESIGGPQACSLCGGAGEVMVFWASPRTMTTQNHRHLIVEDSSPARGLCEREFPAEDLVAPDGMVCMGCIAGFDNLSTVAARLPPLAELSAIYREVDREQSDAHST